MQLRAVDCPKCQQRTPFLWLREREAFCDDCFSNHRTSEEKEPAFELLLNPKRGTDCTWAPGGDYAFGDVAAFLNGYDLRWKKPLSHSAFGRLLAVLENLVPRPPEIDKARVQRLETLLARMKELRRQIDATREQLRDKRISRDPQRRRNLNNNLVAYRADLVRVEREYERVAPPVHAAVEALRTFSDKVERQIYKRLKDAYDHPQRHLVDAPWEAVGERVYWRILPPGRGGVVDWHNIEEHFSRRTGEQFEVERLRMIYEFNPTRIFVGEDEFEGYFVFIFEDRGRAFLECPKIGNAIYVMNAGDWKVLSRLTKVELRRHQDVHRIPHLGDGWKRKVRKYLAEHAGAAERVGKADGFDGLVMPP